MKKTAIVLLMLAAAPAWAVDYVRGYVRRDGTYVQPHYRSSPDSSRLNNFSTQGNYNPYSGKSGTVDPYRYNPPSLNYGSQRNNGWGYGR